MKTPLLATLISLTLAGLAPSRTWTSADGSKTFEAEFVSATENMVTVLKKGRKKSFKLEVLSEQDRKWIAEKREKAAAADADREAAANFSETKFGKALKKLKKPNGNRFSKHELETVPKMFILYYSASW